MPMRILPDTPLHGGPRKRFDGRCRSFCDRMVGKEQIDEGQIAEGESFVKHRTKKRD